jgi:hypothetical protein
MPVRDRGDSYERRAAVRLAAALKDRVTAGEYFCLVVPF